MDELYRVNWHLQGEVNSEGFALAGSGFADLATGATELELTATPSFPTGFDPALSDMICNFTLAGYAAVPDVPVSMRDAVDARMYVSPRRQVIITDHVGEEIARLEALTAMEVDERSISVTNHLTGVSRLPDQVRDLEGEELLVPGRPGTATGIARYVVVLDNGDRLEGMTVVPYQFDTNDVEVTPAKRVLADRDRQWVSASEVRLSATNRWLPLVPAGRPAEA